MRAVIYLRVSTDEQAESGLGLEAQEARCRTACATRGWDIVEVIIDAGVSGTVAPEKREGLARALAMLEAPKRSRTADVLVVSKLDRLARSAFDTLWLRRQSEQVGWALLILDPEIDTTHAAGKFQLTVMAGVAELERDLIAQRTRDALAAKKARGARLGRPVTLPPELRARIGVLRSAGVSLAQIADTLNTDDVRQGNGAMWTKSAVQKVLRSLDLDRMALSA
jgi:DNA invertase Pin-like site-specific DNA recombinase